MNSKDYKKISMKKFNLNNYNCCQAVLCTYCEEFGLSENIAFKLTEGFGSGMGGLKDTCGAVTGMFLVLSLANSAGNKNNPLETKQETYRIFQEMAREFEAICGSRYCQKLKNIQKQNKKISCEYCVEVANEILLNKLKIHF